jgi:hypothetical protein
MNTAVRAQTTCARRNRSHMERSARSILLANMFAGTHRHGGQPRTLRTALCVSTRRAQ